MTRQLPLEELEPYKLSARQRLWQKFIRNPVGVVGALVLLVVLGGAVLAEHIAPHEPNRQRLIARFKPPFWASGEASPILWGQTMSGVTSGVGSSMGVAFPSPWASAPWLSVR